MSNPAELALVIEAVKSGATVTGCSEWDDKEAERVRGDPSLQGLTPEYIKKRCIDFVSSNGTVKQVKETRPQYSHRAYYYKLVFPEPGFAHGIFVEMELTEDDPDLPGVTIVNAHPQSK